MTRRQISIRYKFLLVTVSVLILAVAAYLLLAVRLFNQDKSAYVYDNSAALVETLSEEVTTGLLGAIKSMRLAAIAVLSQEEPGDETGKAGEDHGAMGPAIGKMIAADEDIVGLTVTPLVGSQRYLHVDAKFIEPYGIGPEAVEKELLASTGMDPLLTAEKTRFDNLVIEGRLPLLRIRMLLEDETGAPWAVAVAVLRQDKRLAMFQRSTVYTTYLTDGTGRILAHGNQDLVMSGATLAGSPIFREIHSQKVAKGAREFPTPEGSRIVAFKKIGLGGLIAFAEIPTEVAFLASRQLIEKSATFAVLILAAAFLLSLVFTKRMTAALGSLYAATLRIATGDFAIDVKVRTNDEVGALATSFNRMAREIDRLMIETADKARMEKELETAQLVQENFFPKEDASFGDFQVAATFQPASECGGDWWGYFEAGGKLYLYIGDATGHGVPAALITAAAHACTATLEHLAGTGTAIPLTPGFIMQTLNAAVLRSGRGQVKMTFFVAAIDLATGSITYCNAGHDMPLICRATGGETPSREHLDTFDGRPDRTLGQDLATRYHEHEDQIGPGDTVVWYTDGLTECRSGGGEEYGERRLLKAFLASANRTGAEIRDHLMSEAGSFIGDHLIEDDVTLVVVRRTAASTSSRLAG